MPLITVTGVSIGAGAQELGAEVARRLGIEYVDRIILAEAARQIGSTPTAVAEQVERPLGFGDRVADFVRNVFERSALAGSGADPYFGGGMDMMLVREYRDIPEAASGDDNDQQILQVTMGVIQEIAQRDNAVIIGRGAHVILRDWPGALHVGTVASREAQVRRVMERERLGREEAEAYCRENDRGRDGFYHRFFGLIPVDASNFHMTINTERLDVPAAAELVVAASALITT